MLSKQLSLKDPKNANFIIDIITKSRSLGTKTHYVSAFRQWVVYCMTIMQNPFETPFDHEIVMFWIADRVQRNNSIGSLNNWTGMLNWLCEISNASKIWKTHNDYTTFIKALRKEFGTTQNLRLPFTLKHIFDFTNKMGLNTKTAYSIDLDILLKVIIVQTYFFTMSRPCELMWSKYSKSKFGLKFQNLIKNKHFFHLKILHHKSMKNKNDYKNTYIGKPICNNPICKCHVLNTHFYLQIYIYRRSKLLNPHKHLLISNRTNVFVFKNGKILTTTDLTKITKYFVSLVIENERDRYTAYSYRIGGATRSSSVGIPHMKILKFVGWSNTYCGDSSTSYMRPSVNDLKIFQYEMIHGPLNINPNATNLQNCYTGGQVFDPWTKAFSKSRPKN